MIHQNKPFTTTTQRCSTSRFSIVPLALPLILFLRFLAESVFTFVYNYATGQLLHSLEAYMVYIISVG